MFRKMSLNINKTQEQETFPSKRTDKYVKYDNAITYLILEHLHENFVPVSLNS